MAHYTMTLNDLIGKYDIGLKDYPIYEEKHREELNNKIINHYRFREIGLETPSLFIYYLNQKMDEIMPYYNQLFHSESIEFNPLYNIEIIETYKGDGENISESESLNKYADTPSSATTDQQLKDNKYITNANTDKENGKSESKNSYEKKTIGSSAGLPFSKAIKQWREIMINIDMKIISELSELFLNIY